VPELPGPVQARKDDSGHTTYEELRWCLGHPQVTPYLGCPAPPDDYHEPDPIPTLGGTP
jgi:hypothetical protein